eukprot:1641049-Pleurochrysis_carterae.AAC.2
MKAKNAALARFASLSRALSVGACGPLCRVRVRVQDTPLIRSLLPLAHHACRSSRLLASSTLTVRAARAAFPPLRFDEAAPRAFGG